MSAGSVHEFAEGSWGVECHGCDWHREDIESRVDANQQLDDHLLSLHSAWGRS